MPAIHPARLRQQAALVAAHFGEPTAFVRSLHHLLEFYAERSYRPGQSGEPPPLLPAYKVRAPVLRQLLLELTPMIRENPEQALVLCDALWEQAYLEFRELAISLLGQVACILPEPGLGRARQWLAPNLESILVDHIFDIGLRCVYQNDPAAMASFIEKFLDSNDDYQNRIGLRAMMPLIEEPGFENLPICFQLIQHLVRSTPRSLRPELLNIITGLVRQSPQETAYFLRQNLALPDNQDTGWLIRNTVDIFPPELGQSLRSMEREVNERNRKAEKPKTGLSR